MSATNLILGVLLLAVYASAIRAIALALDTWPDAPTPEPGRPEPPPGPEEPEVPPVTVLRLRPADEAAARIHATEGVTRCDCYQCVVVRSVIDQLFGGEE